MKHTLNQLKETFREKLESDPSLSPTYRQKIMTLMDETLGEIQKSHPINSIFPFS